MDTIRHIFRIGHGPSSSHTMAPRRAAEIFLQRYLEASRFEVILYGSLASTGRGHMTDRVVEDVFSKEKVSICWKPEITLQYHPNGMDFSAFGSDGQLLGTWRVFSIGGGALSEGPDDKEERSIYPHHSMREILDYLGMNGQSFWEYVEDCEGKEIWDYLYEVFTVMHDAIDRGLEREGVIPGGLGITRKAPVYYRRSLMMQNKFAGTTMLSAYALAVAEENATGGKIVTAPTCGSCGIVPAVIRHIRDRMDSREENILHALATAGLFGNLAKHNGSISGAAVGCQGEVGVASSMAAAAATQMYSGSIRQIEYAAEMALEHHLGLTCDPVNGLVQVPCIERNAFGAGTAVYAAQYATFSDGSHRVSFDDVVEVMMHTGVDMPSLYRETSEGGLAKVYRMPGQESSF